MKNLFLVFLIIFAINVTAQHTAFKNDKDLRYLKADVKTVKEFCYEPVLRNGKYVKGN